MSGGLAAEVSVPTAVAGVGIAGTGVAIAGSALSNMFDVRIQKSSKKQVWNQIMNRLLYLTRQKR